MTFAIVLASRTAIWASTDRQLTDLQNTRSSSNSGVKITCIETKDGVALLAYAGIGRVRDTQVSQWVCRTLRGLNLPLERSLEHVSDAAQRRLAPHVRRLGTMHFFIAAAIRERKHCVYEIDLLKSPPQVNRHESRTHSQVKIGISGSGAVYALRHGRSRMQSIARLIKQYEHGRVSAGLIAAQLASLNAVISARARIDGNNTVSPESIVIHRHPKGRRSGGREWCFDAAGKPCNDPDVAVPTVANGMPISEIVDALKGDMLQRMGALPLDAPPEQRVNVSPNEATLRALLERISDKPDEEFR